MWEMHCIAVGNQKEWLRDFYFRGFPGGPVVKNLLCNAGDAGAIPGWGAKIPHAMDDATKTQCSK